MQLGDKSIEPRDNLIESTLKKTYLVILLDRLTVIIMEFQV